MRKCWSGVAAALIFLLAPHSASADSWPNGPVRIIAPFAPGGTADVFARIMADHFSAVFRKPFFVETRSGAGGMIGSQIVALAAPDGYTLLMAGNASHIVAPAFSPAPLYDGVKDFTHVALIGGSPVGLVVNPALPVNTFAEFMPYVKASPNPLDYTSSGIGTNGFLFGEEFAAKEGLRLNHIPYKGGGPAMADLVAGHVKIATVTFSSAAAQVRGGKLKVLALSADQRLPGFPEVPTFKELGYPEMISLSWFALVGPKGLPREIVDALNREVAVILARPDMKARLDQDAIEARPLSPEETTQYFERETARWAPLAAAFRAKGFKSE